MFPNIINKRFINLNNSATVVVKEQLEDVVILDDGSRMAVSRLLDKNAFDEYIDPNLFFNNPATFDALSSKIKSVSDDILATMKDDDSPAIIQVDPDEERLLLQRRADDMMSGKSVVDAMQSQNEMLGHLLTEDDVIDNIVGTLPSVDNHNSSVKITEPVYTSPTPIQHNNVQEAKVITDDPILTMFKGVKRSVKFETKININELIPRLDFIEMMEDSYNRSIVEYLADEFTNKLLSDPSKIKQMIIDDITSMYKNESVLDNTESIEEIITSNEVKEVKEEPMKASVSSPKNDRPSRKRGPRNNDSVE